jgi:hypothetical protein
MNRRAMILAASVLIAGCTDEAPNPPVVEAPLPDANSVVRAMKAAYASIDTHTQTGNASIDTHTQTGNASIDMCTECQSPSYELEYRLEWRRDLGLVHFDLGGKSGIGLRTDVHRTTLDATDGACRVTSTGSSGDPSERTFDAADEAWAYFADHAGLGKADRCFAFLPSLLAGSAKIERATAIGVTEIDGRSCTEIDARTPDGWRVTLWIDQGSSRLARSKWRKTFEAFEAEATIGYAAPAD